MKIIAHNLNGGVVITYITDNLSIKEYCYKFLNNDQNYVELSNSNFLDIYFKDAWELKNNILSVNIDKAKKIHLEYFRKARTPILAALDIEFMRAVESGDTALQSEIAGKKQALRDVTSIDLPDTLEGIKATWPDILGQSPFS